MDSNTFPAGKYYVGDLCYYLEDDDWEDLLRVSNFEDGVYTLPDGRIFCWFGTAWGDGQYYDQAGRSYSVDSGTIGLIKVPDNQKNVSGGNIIEFNKPFTVEGIDRRSSRESNNTGILRFGYIRIETDPHEESY